MTKAQCRDWHNNLQAQFPADGKRKTALYEGRALSESALFIGGRRIVACRNIKRDVDGHMPIISLMTWDGTWANMLRDVGDTHWLRTSDVFATWTAMAREADLMNEKILGGSQPPSVCQCAAQSQQGMKHPCGRCGVHVPCELLAPGIWDVNECPKCRDTHPPGGLDRGAVQMARLSLKKTLSVEYERRRLDPKSDEFSSTLEGGEKKLLSDLTGLAGTAYVNAFSGKLIQFTCAENHLRPSVNAVFPFGTNATGNAEVHAPNNLAIVPRALNFGKHIQLPITLARISQYCRQMESLNQNDVSHQASVLQQVRVCQEELVEDCRRLTLIRIRAGWTVNERTSRTLTVGLLDYLREEWISGKLHPGSVATPIRRAYFSSQTTSPRWDAVTKDRLLKIVQEIERWTRVELPRQAGCPYFLHRSTMPTDWGWKSCQGLMGDRLQRMTDWCNRYWPTDDTAETLFLECIFQACIGSMIIVKGDPDYATKASMQGKYAEFLGLPMGIDRHDPLTFAVAHRIHGYQMHTGWRASPTSFQDRVDKYNNILVETRTSNFLKHNFEECFSTSVKALVLEVSMPLEFANAELPLAPANLAFEREIESAGKRSNFEDLDGMYSFAEIDDDMCT